MNKRNLISIRHWGDHMPRHQTRDAKLTAGPASRTGTSDMRRIRDEQISEIQKLNAANRQFWDNQPADEQRSQPVSHIADRGQRDMRRQRDQDASKIQEMSAANRRLWGDDLPPAA